MKKTVSIDCTEDRKRFLISFPFDKEGVILKIIKSFKPDPKWNGDCKAWEISNSNPNKITRLLMYLKQNDLGFSISSEVNKIYEQAKEFARKKKEKTDLLEKIKKEENPEVDYSMLENIVPKDVQKRAYKYFEATDGNGILSLKVGRGKTAIYTWFLYSKGYKSLIIVPSQLKIQLVKRCLQIYMPKATYEILNSGDEIYYDWLHDKRKNIIKEDVKDFTIINYDLLIDRNKGKHTKKNIPSARTLESLKIALDKGIFDAVCIDEAHKIKNEKTQWTKFILKYLIDIKHKILSSATPLKKRPMEYFSLLKFIDKKYWNSKVEFGYRFCQPKALPQFSKYAVTYNGAENLEELYYETLPYIFRDDSPDDLEKPKYIVIPFELSTEEQLVYNKIEDGVIKDLNDLDEKNEGTYLINALSIILRLKQYTTSLKKDNAKEIINNIIESDEKIIVFSQFVSGLQNLYETFTNKKSVFYHGKLNNIQKDNCVTEFINNNNCNIFLATQQSAGTGLDGLQEKCHIEIFIDMPWNSSEFEQYVGRCARTGQIETPLIYILLYENTIDQYIYNLVEKSKSLVDKVLDNKEYVNDHSKSDIKDIINYYKNKKKS